MAGISSRLKKLVSGFANEMFCALLPASQVRWAPLGANEVALPFCVKFPAMPIAPLVSRPVVDPPPKLALPPTPSESVADVIESTPKPEVVRFPVTRRVRPPSTSVWVPSGAPTSSPATVLVATLSVTV